ncbi:hypothetical protein RUM43_002472 [Polyplax serrata]|uniref:Uncharacterized protein n=1 Tax=Polyplax serrata TaxID=468196 RepID=A0AAN8S4S4_POLSC
MEVFEKLRTYLRRLAFQWKFLTKLSTDENLITEMLEKFKGVNDGVNSEANTNNNRSNTTNVKPPTLELPCFDEEITEWTTFCDLFTAAIHNN